jgi:hypothetical protein
MPRLLLLVLVSLATLASSQAPSSTAQVKSPDVNLILQRLEDVQHQDPAQSRPYEVTREYKVFRGYDKQPTSEVSAQINFVPPDIKTYKITQARGNSRGEKIVREILDRETESAKKGLSSEINRTNYDFVFLRQEEFGLVPELWNCGNNVPQVVGNPLAITTARIAPTVPDFSKGIIGLRRSDLRESESETALKRAAGWGFDSAWAI